MAYKLVWTSAARDDLHNIIVFIARDNPKRAMSFGYKLISEIEHLHEFPKLGRIVPEFSTDDLRELILGPFRIVYRLNQEKQLCQVLRIWHSARGTPQL